MFTHLLVPLDGSKLAEEALSPALELARRFNSRITLLNVTRAPHVVYDLGSYTYSDISPELQDQAQSEALSYLQAKQAALQADGYWVDIQAIEGEPVAEVILETADQSDVDAIVMSTHGRSGVSRWVFGSVADKVLRHAKVPVLLLRAGACQLDE